MTDVVIIGAGIAGVSTASELVRTHGITDVVLVDPRPPLTLTSDKSGANYRDWWPDRRMVALVRRSIHLMQSLHRSGAPFTMNRRGYLYVTRLAEAAERIPDSVGIYRTAGIESIRIHQPGAASVYQPSVPDGLTGPDGADVLLERTLIQREFPHLSADVAGVIHARNAGSADPVALGRYLLQSAEQGGARVVTGRVTGIDSRSDRVRAVEVISEGKTLKIETRRILNAAGPFLAVIQKFAGDSLPIITVPQQKVWLPDPLGVLPPSAPFTASLDAMEVEVPSGGRRRLPAGLHIKPEASHGRAGIKLGWAFNRDSEKPVWEPKPVPDFPAIVLQGAATIVPGLQAYLSGPLDSAVQTCGYYIKTPDDLPVIGPAGPDGLFVVGGLAGYGAMVACAVGEITAAWIAGTTRPSLADDFVPRRFEEPGFVTEAPTTTGAL